MLFIFFTKKVLKYDIVSYSLKAEEEQEMVSDLSYEDIEFDVVYVKTYEDEDEDKNIHIVVKDETNETYDLVALMI